MIYDRMKFGNENNTHFLKWVFMTVKMLQNQISNLNPKLFVDQKKNNRINLVCAKQSNLQSILQI